METVLNPLLYYTKDQGLKSVSKVTFPFLVTTPPWIGARAKKRKKWQMCWGLLQFITRNLAH